MSSVLDASDISSLRKFSFLTLTDDDSNKDSIKQTPVLAKDCKDHHGNGHNTSGVYEIYPYGTITSPVRVHCDMDTMDGGWTVIQKREDGSQSFEKNWEEYKNGFGTPKKNDWIGNDVIHQLTKGKNSKLYVSITLANGSRLYELYAGFSISNEAEKYRLFLAPTATGTLGDRMLNTGKSGADLSGMYFSTPDRDNDRWSGGNCAAKWKGGWWYNACHDAFLNGPWYPENWHDPWRPTVTSSTSVRGTVMMVKRH
ncbi:fibroleukin-like [Saccostrea echinata]|uniref:fibroleukin-like n=1 Tax=Saccostrea echinata TaxID=191078 RepID=UPI002A8048E8|nr:fibroleukin-like [Saccostrea echinata]